MYVLRSIDISDLETLYELSKIQVFINLPQNLNKLKEQIKISQKSFKRPYKDLSRNYYIFVLEDTEKQKIIGTSMIHGKHGTENEPHFFLKVGSENKYSETMHIGFIHKTLKLGLNTDGWTEIGGLVLNPDYRGSKEKLGKQLSFVRFLYMGMKPEQFTKIIHSELMPPFDENGKSPLWEAIGRRFMHMEYDEADERSRKNKEFILSLYPSDTIYETLLPPDARASIGEVGETTKPVKKMLEKIGFQYINEVDPFDGGPHYRCPLKDISLVKNMQNGIVEFFDIDQKLAKEVLISLNHPEHSFFAIKTKIMIEQRKGKNYFLLDNKLQENLKFASKVEASLIFF